MIESFDWGVALLRLVAGVVILAHGVKHARGRTKTAKWFGSIGFRQPELQWFASTATEIGVGVLLIVGLGTSLAAAGLVAVMTVAFWTVHRSVGFWVTARPDEGWEYVLVLGTVGAAIAIGGPGEFSIDATLGIEDVLSGWVGAVLVAGGIVAAVAQMATFFRPNEATGT
ncbi:MAG: DoxX family protein [Actinomycetota bacterium]|nr:DoxX family protein [Actinomycetota bacterium]